MPLFAYGTSVHLTSFVLLSQNDLVVVGPGATVSANVDVFLFSEFGNSLTVLGTIAGGNLGVALGGTVSSISSHTTTIGAAGSISGFIGVQANVSSGQILNAGTITGVSDAIVVVGTQVGRFEIINSGVITSATGHGILGATTAITDFVLENSGTIAGRVGFDSISMDNLVAGDDTIINSGVLRGDVKLGGGDDIFETRGTGLVLGEVSGDAGNDTFRPGRAEETFFGGVGTDILDLRTSAGQTVSLDPAIAGTGVGAGDSYVDIEIVRGSQFGADVIYGNNASNRLFGVGGNDRLNGQGGTDLLEGGTGIDSLSGGSGNDSFVFRALNQIGDLITDFSSSVTGNDDRIFVDISGFGITLPGGTLTADRFVSRADNVAQDSLDRFVFRTTDKTLWFDRDGTGAAGPVLVADLQASATMTAADIFIALGVRASGGSAPPAHRRRARNRRRGGLRRQCST